MRVALIGAELEENLALRYLRGALVADGHEAVQLRFDRVDDLERVAAELVASRVDLAGLSMVFTRRAREFADLATRARELGFDAPIVAGGHFAAFHARELLRDVPALDMVALGEGETILRDLARAGRPDGVRGLVWRSADGEVVTNEPTAPQDLDALPWPVHKEPFDRYLGLPIADVLSSRGCSHACSFCSIAAWHRLCGGDRLRHRSADDVAAEMADLWERGVRVFNFHDDNFLPRGADAAWERVRELRTAFDARIPGRFAFAIKARPDSVELDLFAALREMGLFRVFLGIEAGTATSLRQLGRRQSLADNLRALEVVRELGLHAAFNLLLFNPESTLEDVAGNVAFLRANPDRPMNFCRTEVYAGTPLERRLRRQGRLLGDWWGLDYRIADPLAQRAFELVYPLFRERCYQLGQGHQLAMRVDYEARLLEDFWGLRPGLARRARDFVVRLNHDTCDRLDRVLDAVRVGTPPARIRHDERPGILAANRRLRQEGLGLLDEFRAATGGAGRRRWRGLQQRAAAAGGAAPRPGGAGCGGGGGGAAPPPPPPPPAGRPPAGRPGRPRSWNARISIFRLF